MDNKETIRTFDSQTKYGNGGKINIDSVLESNKHLDWVRRLYEKDTPSITLEGQSQPSTHFMESSDNLVYPTIVRKDDGKLEYLGKNARDYAIKTKTFIEFPSEEQATWFGENYKQGTNVLSDFKKEQGGYIRTSKSGRKFVYPSIQEKKQEIINKLMKTTNKPDD